MGLIVVNIKAKAWFHFWGNAKLYDPVLCPYFNRSIFIVIKFLCCSLIVFLHPYSCFNLLVSCIYCVRRSDLTSFKVSSSNIHLSVVINLCLTHSSIQFSTIDCLQQFSCLQVESFVVHESSFDAQLNLQWKNSPNWLVKTSTLRNF